MKTITILVAVVAMGMGAMSASAQVNNINLTTEQAAVLATIPGNAQTTACSEVKYHFHEGQLTSVEVEKHSGVSLRPFAGVSLMSGDSDNWGDLSATTGMFGAAITVTHHRKGWAVDLLGEVYGAINTKATVETLSTEAFQLGATGMIGINPCKSAKLYGGITGMYLNSTSRYMQETEALKLDIPYKTNAWFFGPTLRIALNIFSINSTKNVHGVPVVKHHPVSLVIDGKYLFGKISEPDGSKATERRAELTMGLQFALF